MRISNTEDLRLPRFNPVKLLLLAGFQYYIAFLGCIAGDFTSGQTEAKLPLQIIKIGNAVLLVEVASSSLQRDRGLMFRYHLDENKGMIFLMPRIGSVSFWMKNTFIPLSLAYLNANGEIVEIENKKPFDTRITHSHSGKIAYVLEVNEDWFARNNIGIGTSMRPPPSTWNVITTH